MGQFTIYPHTGLIKCEMVPGQDETMDTTIPVTGMLTTDGVIAVCILSAAFVMGQYRDPSDFDPHLLAGNMTVVAHAENTTGLYYLVFWQDLT